MKLIVVTPPYFFVEEDQIITSLFEEGLDILHLRKPETPAIYSERLLTLIPARYHKRIATHEHFYLKQEFGLMGIHLNARNPQEPNGYSGHVSCSCHTFDELREKKKYFDYVFLSPVFDSISKAGYSSAFAPDELQAAGQEGLIDKRVIGLGGIDESNIRRIKELGFGGAAILGGLWKHFNPLTDYDYKSVLEHFRQLKKLAD